MSFKEILERIRSPERHKISTLARREKEVIAGIGAGTIIGAFLLFVYLREKNEPDWRERVTASLLRFFKRTDQDLAGEEREAVRGLIDEVTADLTNDPTIETLGNLAIPEAALRTAQKLEEAPGGKRLLALFEETYRKIAREFDFLSGEELGAHDKIEILSAMIGGFVGAIVHPKKEE